MKFKRTIQRAFESVYDKERIDISHEESYDDSEEYIVVLVHFPHVVVRNDVGGEHDIYDFYARFSFKIYKDYFALSDIRVIRSTFMYSDIVDTYRGDIRVYVHSHSHVMMLGWVHLSNMCISSDSFFSQLKGSMEKKCNADDIPLLLHAFNQLIQYEDLNGVPYARMSMCKGSFYRRRCPNYDVSMFVQKAIEGLEKLSYTISDERMTIIGLREKIALLPCSYKYKAHIINGNPYLKKRTIDVCTNQKLFNFREMPVYVKVIDDSKEIKAAHPLQVHPEIVEEVAITIEEEFMNYLSFNVRHEYTGNQICGQDNNIEGATERN